MGLTRALVTLRSPTELQPTRVSSTASRLTVTANTDSLSMLSLEPTENQSRDGESCEPTGGRAPTKPRGDAAAGFLPAASLYFRVYKRPLGHVTCACAVWSRV